MPLIGAGERYIRGFQQSDTEIEIGLKLEGIPADPNSQFGKHTVADQKDLFQCLVIQEPAYHTMRASHDGGKTFVINLEFVTSFSPAQESAINNKNALKKLTYMEAVKLSGAEQHEIYYQIDVENIQSANARGALLQIIEAESVLVKYKPAIGGGQLGKQEVVPLTRKA